jgi:hypothetical protein
MVKASRRGPAGLLSAIAGLAKSALDTGSMLVVGVEHRGAGTLSLVSNSNREFNLLNANLVVSAGC